MQRRGAAEGDQGVLANDGAALDRMHAGGARHVLAHDLMHGVGRSFRRQSQRLADVAQQGLFRQFGAKLDRPACKCVGIDLAECDVRICHGGALTAAAVAGRPRLG